MAGERTLERVELPARQVHVTGRRGLVKLGELTPQSSRVHGLNARFGTRHEERLKALVCEVLDHKMKCIA